MITVQKIKDGLKTRLDAATLTEWVEALDAETTNDLTLKQKYGWRPNEGIRPNSLVAADRVVHDRLAVRRSNLDDTVYNMAFKIAEESLGDSHKKSGQARLRNGARPGKPPTEHNKYHQACEELQIEVRESITAVPPDRQNKLAIPVAAASTL